MIRDYFEGDDSYIPVSELIYLHEHPLIRQSFLVEIERLINTVSEYLVKRNTQGAVVNKFIDLTIKLGAELPTVNKQNAPIILDLLRKIYTMSNKLLN